MSKTKAGGTSKLGRDSESKRLGVKIYGGQLAKTGDILVRQRGFKYHPGTNVGVGKDDTLFALKNGEVAYQSKRIGRFTGKKQTKTVVNVVSQ